MAKYDNLIYSKIKASMVTPIALVESVKEQAQNVDQAIEEFKQEIEAGGNQVSHKVNMNEFYDLFLKKGGN